MLRYLSSLLIALAIAVAAAPAADAQSRTIRLGAPFDPGQLDRQELRVLQAALTIEGEYNAGVDGVWGDGSRNALNRWLRQDGRNGQATWRNIRRLLRNYQAEREAAGWGPVWHEQDRLWHTRPNGILERREAEQGVRFATRDAGLIVVVRGTAQRPDGMHRRIRDSRTRGTAPRQVERNGLLVTTVQQPDGRTAYVRSEYRINRWLTHLFLADADNLPRFRLMARSFSNNNEQSLAIPTRGVLASIMSTPDNQPQPPRRTPVQVGERVDPSSLSAILREAIEARLDTLFEEQQAARQPQPQPRQPAPRGGRAPNLASGVFVNTTDVLTHAAFVEGCRRIEMTGGKRLSQIAVDRAAGVAVLSAPGRSRNWLALSENAPREGAEIVLLSRRPADGRERVRWGTVLGAGREGTLRHDVDLRGRGYTGAPILGMGGRLTGLHVGGAQSDSFVDNDVLKAVLRDARVPFSTERRNDRLLQNSVPAEYRNALVALRCAQ